MTIWDEPLIEWLLSELFADDADGDVMGNMTGFSGMVAKVWQYTKKAKISRKEFSSCTQGGHE